MGSFRSNVELKIFGRIKRRVSYMERHNELSNQFNTRFQRRKAMFKILASLDINFDFVYTILRVF
jgi:hypothetical protein